MPQKMVILMEFKEILFKSLRIKLLNSLHLFKLFSGNLETIKSLHDLGADIRAEDENKRTALHWGANNGSWLHFKYCSK